MATSALAKELKHVQLGEDEKQQTQAGDSYFLASQYANDNNPEVTFLFDSFGAVNVAMEISAFMRRHGVRCSLNSSHKGALTLILLTSDLVADCARKGSSMALQAEDLKTSYDDGKQLVLAVVADPACFAPKNWGSRLRFLGDIFYVNWLSEDKDKMRGELLSKVLQGTGISMATFHITGRNTPDWRSYVRQDRPFLDDGFSLAQKVQCGTGGQFEAYTCETPGTTMFAVEGATWWAPTVKTSMEMFEWRVFSAGTGKSKKFLVTSNRRDTCPGWSVLGVFYARGLRSLGCDQHRGGRGGGGEFHLFLSHNWNPPANNHARVVELGAWLQQEGVIPWLDQEQLDMAKFKSIPESLHEGIASSSVILVLVTEGYIKQCASGDEFDNCYREFQYYSKRAAAGDCKLIMVAGEECVREPSSWGPLQALSKRAVLCSLVNNTNAERRQICKTAKEMLNIQMARFYVTGRSEPDYRSYVQKDNPYTDEGFSQQCKWCGANGYFQAYLQPVPGTIKVVVQGATFWASSNQLDLGQLQWRYFKAGNKYLVTSNRLDMAPGWTFCGVFYARGHPSNGCSQKASVDF